MNNLTMNNHFAKLALLLSAVLILSGCSTLQQTSNDIKDVAVAPAPNAGFIQNPEQDKKIAFLPFQRAWIKPGFDMSRYQQLYVAPVNTNYMLKMDWLHKLSSVNYLTTVKKDTANLAVYFQNQIIKDFNDDPNQRFLIINSPAEASAPALTLEIALVEIDPSMPLLHAAGWAVAGGGTAAGIINQRKAAFEGRLRDLKTGEVVATFADRNMQDVGPLDLTRLTWYGPAKGIMDMWAKQFVQIANRKPGEVISDPVAFTLRPF